jgi:hypothetical protein
MAGGRDIGGLDPAKVDRGHLGRMPFRAKNAVTCETMGTVSSQTPFRSVRQYSALMEVIMRLATLAFTFVLTAFSGAAIAMPGGPLPMPDDLIRVQMQCSPQSCIDPRTGVYTQSTCDRYGCRPISGPVGRVGGGRGPAYGSGYDDGYDRRPRRQDWDDGRGRGGGGMDCNASRCIDGNGRVWESTCDRRGCRPLRPARGQRW